ACAAAAAGCVVALQASPAASRARASRTRRTRSSVQQAACAALTELGQLGLVQRRDLAPRLARDDRGERGVVEQQLAVPLVPPVVGVLRAQRAGERERERGRAVRGAVDDLDAD